MERRKFIAGLGSLTAAGAAGIGTGAFASVNANRGVNINLDDDADAYLGLSSDTKYASGSGSGMISLDLDDLNEEATTSIRNVFTVTNNGNKPVALYINSEALNKELEPGNNANAKKNQIHFYVGVPGGSTLDTYDPDDLVDTAGNWVDTSDNRVIGPGKSVTVGLYIVNSGNVDWSNVTEDISINAYDRATLANNDVGPSDS